MSPELLGGIMLSLMLLVIFIGFPISFTLLLLGLVFGWIGLGDRAFYLMVFQTIGLMKEEVLAAVPLFIFMGYLMEQGGLMERLFKGFQLLMGPVPGSLYVGVLVTATIFGIAAGTVGATVVLMGIMSVPILTKSGYDIRMSAGAITAGGTLGILIPPSVMLIVMGPVLGVSVSDLYASAFGPGFLLAGIYLTYLLGRSFLNPKLGPPVPMEERVHSVTAMVKEVLVGVVPLIALIGAALGSILAGLATPTEAAGIGALGAALIAACYGKLSYAGVKRAVLSTTATSAMVLLLAVTSNIFGAVFARMGTANWITETMLALPLSPVMMLVVVLFLIFLLGWPFEWPAIILVFLPIFYPVMDALRPALGEAMGIPVDMVMVWFGALVAVTLQTAFLSPPVAMSAYYLRQVVKEWSLATIYKGMFEFMILQCIAIGLIIAFPAIATWFPERLQAESRAVKTEEVDDSMNSLEEDPLKQGQDSEEGAGEKK